MKRRDFLKILGLGTAAVAFGVPSLELTPLQSNGVLTAGDTFSVYGGFRGLIHVGVAPLQASFRKVYQVVGFPDRDSVEVNYYEMQQTETGEVRLNESTRVVSAVGAAREAREGGLLRA